MTTSVGLTLSFDVIFLFMETRFDMGPEHSKVDWDEIPLIGKLVTLFCKVYGKTSGDRIKWNLLDLHV